jgi:hypothetical protein
MTMAAKSKTKTVKLTADSYTQTSLATTLGVTISRIARLRKIGAIEGQKAGTKVMFSRDEARKAAEAFGLGVK